MGSVLIKDGQTYAVESIDGEKHTGGIISFYQRFIVASSFLANN